MAVVAPHHGHNGAVIGEDDSDVDGPRGDVDAGGACIRGLAIAKVPSHPTARLAERPPPSEDDVDMLWGDTALRAAEQGVGAEVQHDHLRMRSAKAKLVPAQFQWFDRHMISEWMQVDLSGERSPARAARTGGAP